MKDKEVMPAAELQKQKLYAADVAAIMQVRAMGTEPKAFVRTYGCQQNVADGEKIKGMLAEMGFAFTDDENEADFILFNTCAIREHAEDRVYGNIGALKNVKRRNPSVLIAVCGCMMEQAHVAERIRTTFPFVNIVFGTHVIHRLPEMIFTAVTDSKRVFLRGEESKEIVEGLPVRRDGTARAWVTVMYGCDNFCSYCVVPYVRGREKSRHPDAIVEECRGLIEQGYKEITLLGQNVNSYGKGLEEKINFSELLRRIDAIDGDYRLRFMTSHPKDATRELFDTIAESRHICHHIHLPFQSGNSRVLKAMNRRYTKEQYLELAAKIRREIPDISLTTDIMVGFPGETAEDVDDTIDVIRKVGFDNAFTFIYSVRTGTPAAAMEQVPEEEVHAGFDRVLEAVQETARKQVARLQGQTLTALVEEVNEQDASLVTGRLSNNTIVHFPGSADLIGQIVPVKLEECHGFYYTGHRVEETK